LFSLIQNDLRVSNMLKGLFLLFGH